MTGQSHEPRPSEVLASVIAEWVDDPESDVVYAEELDGRWAVRMHQTVRDATTVWWEVGERSIRAEAYVLPLPEEPPAQALRLCMVRNASAWRTRFALDSDGAVVIRSRVAVGEATSDVLDAVLGEIYQFVETTFRPLVRMTFGSRETNG